MNVLHVVSGLGELGGVETFCKSIMSCIDTDKFNVDFLVMSLDVKENEKYFTDKGCAVYHIYGGKGLKRRNKAKRDFFKSLKKKYDIVHIHTVLTSAYYVAKLAKKYLGAVVVVHSHTASNYKGTMFRNLLARPLLNRYADVKVACSERAGEFLFGKKSSKSVEVIHNPVDIDRFVYNPAFRAEKRSELNVAEGETLIGNVGRISPEKNQAFLLNVLETLTKNDPTYKLVIVGDGAKRNALEEITKKTGLIDRVIFTGARRDVEQYMSAMDVFAFPSLFEGLPTVIIEAQSNGLPIVCSSAITDEVIVSSSVTKLELKKQEWVNALTRTKRNKNNITPQEVRIFETKNIVIELEKLYETICNA